MNSTAVVRNVQRASRHALRHYHAPFRISRGLAHAQREFHVHPSPLTSPRKPHALPAGCVAHQLRRESTATGSRPLTDRRDVSEQENMSEKEAIEARKAQEPAYELTFTCRKCMHRSSHRVTKQAYHFGTTLITCPGCKNRHLISDHMKIFSDKGITIEDILREKGQYLRKGRLGEDGDIEFYDEESNEIGRMQKEGQESKGEGTG